MIKGKVGEFNASEERAHTTHHPPVLGNAKIKADNGIYPTGMMASVDGNGDLVPYTGTDDSIAVLIDLRVDTSESDSALVLRHGTVALDRIRKGAGVGIAPTAADLAALSAAGIYAV